MEGLSWDYSRVVEMKSTNSVGKRSISLKKMAWC